MAHLLLLLLTTTPSWLIRKVPNCILIILADLIDHARMERAAGNRTSAGLSIGNAELALMY
jgi:hypothetical protein